MTLKRSLTVIQTGTIRKLGCGFLFAFHINYGRILAVSMAVSRDLENRLNGFSRSLKMAPFDRPYTTFYWSAIVNIYIYIYLSILHRFWVISTYLTLNDITTLKSG